MIDRRAMIAHRTMIDRWTMITIRLVPAFVLAFVPAQVFSIVVMPRIVVRRLGGSAQEGQGAQAEGGDSDGDAALVDGFHKFPPC